MSDLIYLQGYPGRLLFQVRTPINEQRLGNVLAKHYSGTHDYTTDRALWQYTRDLKNQFLRNALPINKVMCDNKIHVLKDALGLHTAVSHVQGGRLKAKAEVRAVTVSCNAPEPFLRMIVMHELAYLEEKEHNKAFYQLCYHMEPRYHQLEFNIRLWLTQLPLRQDRIRK